MAKYLGNNLDSYPFDNITVDYNHLGSFEGYVISEQSYEMTQSY